MGQTCPGPVSPDGFFRVTRQDGVWAFEEPVFGVRSFLVEGSEAALLVDAGTGLGDLPALVRATTEKPVSVLLTHGHFDHVGHAPGFGMCLVHRAFRLYPPTAQEARTLHAALAGRPGAKAGPGSGPSPGRKTETGSTPAFGRIGLAGGERIELGGIRLQVLSVSGHTAGDLALWEPDRGWLFTGDLVYPGPIELTGPEADLQAYRRSIRQLASLGSVRTLLCGHDASFADRGLLGEIAESLNLPDQDLRTSVFARHRFVFDPAEPG